MAADFWAALRRFLDQEWTLKVECSIQASGLLLAPDSARHDWRPDCILISRSHSAVVLIELTQCRGHTADDARNAQEQKKQKYES